MKRMALAVSAAACLATSTCAADMPVKAAAVAKATAATQWDIAFGGWFASDYLFRGITQTAHKPSAGAWFEPHYNITPNLQLYVGAGGESIKSVNQAAAEVDVWAGIRPTFGPVAFDFGIWSYNYPGGEDSFVDYWGAAPAISRIWKDKSFYEGYGSAAWAINPNITVGAKVNYSPSFLNTGAEGTYYAGFAKFTAPAGMLPNSIGAYLSGEFGHQHLGTASADGWVLATPTPLPSWNHWNVGVGFTWKEFALDLRYVDTDLSKTDCFNATLDPHATLNGSGQLQSNWCGSTFVAKLSAATSVFSLR